MNDDGTNVRTLLSADDIPPRPSKDTTYTIQELSSVSTHPAGDVVVFSGEWSGSFGEWSRWTPTQGISTACGVFCVGMYVLGDGHVARLSPDPYPCPLNPCAALETDAEIADDGSVVFNYVFANWASKCDGGRRWCDESYAYTLHRRTTSDASTPIKTMCEDKGKDPAPVPGDPAIVMHAGCRTSPPEGGSQYHVSLTNGVDQFGSLWFDDWEGDDPSWSPDGTQVAVHESYIGQNPGIWVNTIPAEGNIQFRRAVRHRPRGLHLEPTPDQQREASLRLEPQPLLGSGQLQRVRAQLGNRADNRWPRQRLRFRLDRGGHDRALRQAGAGAEPKPEPRPEPVAGPEPVAQPDPDPQPVAHPDHRPGRQGPPADGAVVARLKAGRGRDEGACTQGAEVPHHARQGGAA